MKWLFFEKIMQIKIFLFCALHMTKFENLKVVYLAFIYQIFFFCNQK
jgi:hypothetical protein